MCPFKKGPIKALDREIGVGDQAGIFYKVPAGKEFMNPGWPYPYTKPA
jgi:hypothetical protein